MNSCGSTVRCAAGSEFDVIRARRSVMRLLQLSSNPQLALRPMMENGGANIDSGIVAQVMREGHSQKMLQVADHARQLAAEGRKVVIWTIFVETIRSMEAVLSDLNPVSVYGATPSGDPEDPATREGKIRTFQTDPVCMALIANPAATGEGVNLQQACHDAIYLDRNYNSTQYLQSVDRIHRLGTPRGGGDQHLCVRIPCPQGDRLH